MIILNIFIGLIGLGLVVTIHEFGHLLAAKWSGIGVDVFSVGWGPKLLGRKIGDTEYRISALPIGGFVRLRGEHALMEAYRRNRATIADFPKGFFSAAPWKRVVVGAGGPFANFVLALGIFAITAMIGYSTEAYSNKIVLLSSINPQITMPADNAGLQNGDLIVAINDNPTSNYNEIRQEIFESGSSEIEIRYLRDNVEQRTTLVAEHNSETGIPQIGIYPWIEPQIATVDPDSPADVAGLHPGDTIVSVNDIAVSNAIEISQLIESSGPVAIEYLREGDVGTTSLQVPSESEGYGIRFVSNYIQVSPKGPIGALGYGLQETWRVVRYTAIGLRSLFSGVDVTNVVAGPIRLTTTIGEVATSSIEDGIGAALRIFFNFLAILSVALCIMNLLPIPILDGGQILLYSAEGITRKRFSPAAIIRYQKIGGILIAVLFVLALTSDALYLFRR